MADNIKIIGNINDIQRISRLRLEDQNLLNTQIINQTFGFENDYIEFYVYDTNQNLLYSNLNYKNFKSSPDYGLNSIGTIPVIEIDPINDIQSLEYISGEFVSKYNFFKSTSLDSSINLFIQEISDDRTEIRINSNSIISSDLIARGNTIINELTNSISQKSFLLNQINKNQILIINAVIDETSLTPSILLKLYEPLPLDIELKSIIWVTEEIIEPYVFDINLDTSILPSPVPQLKGPNFSIELDIKQNLGTKYENYSSLISYLTGSSYNQVLNYMGNNSYDLNIDYTSFENFVHFSSAKKRLEIFYDKIKQIEDYNNNINIITGSTNILKNEQTSSIKSQIDNIVQNFDGYENYLYFESSSYAWPKINSTKPFILSSTSSVDGWYGAYTSSAIIYDDNNLDYLYHSLPSYVKNDYGNYQSYYDFIDMIGHYFDNIWIYIDSINELYNADNNLEKGISKDIVYDALKSLGVKLYNNKGDENFSNYIGGLNNGDTLFTDDFSVTSSYLNNIPKKDQLAELYKRIYHNIPLLSKTKGTSAGLQNLITTFGVTSSIFTPKELGGSTRTGGLKGYDNDKITIQNNTITGSVLSPFISVQQPFTGSSDFTSTDLHFIDLSFSPQTALDSRVSASIAVSKPTFSIDDYIGDPRLMESSSYNGLNIQKQEYFIASGSITDKLDYKGFFELIKYFDNSLFKMLKDFIPARTNALTGITIKSPVLERNKIKSYKPKAENELIYDAEYNAPVISEDNDYHYDKIGGNKSSFYTGELSGSYANINDIFENSNPNEYLHSTGSIDLNKFNHTDFNVTLNNVSSSVESYNRKKLEHIYNSNLQIIGFYSSSAELQDSNQSLLGHQRSRYDGTRLSSLTYNNYSTSSAVYSGDISYGKTSVIDRFTKKLGLFTQIVENPFFQTSKRNNVSLKYLVDENGNLTELNKRNKHWEEVQNVFKSGESLAISLFDNQNPSNQKSTDGVKPIYNSGYNYTPMLYFTGSSSTDKLYFSYSGEDVLKLFNAKNTLSGYISGSGNGNEQYPLKASGSTGKVIYNIFDNIISNDNSLYIAGDAANNKFPSYSVVSNGNYAFNTNFDIGLSFPSTNQSCSFKYDIIKGGIDQYGFPTGSTLATSGIKTFTTSYSVTQFGRGYNYISLPSFTYSDSSYSISNSYSPLTLFDGSSNKIVTLTWSGTTNVFTGDDSNTYYLVLGTWSFDAGGGYYPSFTKLILTTSNDGNMNSNDYILTATNSSQFSNNTVGTLSFVVNSSGDDLIKGDNVYFKLSLLSTSTPNFTASFATTGELKNNLTTNISGNSVFATGSSADSFIACAVSSNNANIDTLVFNAGISAFDNYTFLPNTGSADLLKLYNNYGDVSDTFSPVIGDAIVTYWDGQSTEFNISNVFTSGSYKCLTLDRSLPGSLSTKINNTGDTTTAGVDQFILLKKNKDETNTILNFTKPSGSTSLGFIIPNNLHPDVLANIDTITKEVKQKIIDMGTYKIT